MAGYHRIGHYPGGDGIAFAIGLFDTPFCGNFGGNGYDLSDSCRKMPEAGKHEGV